MGAASYREDDLNRFLANTDPPLGPFPPPSKYVCPFCAAPFEVGAAFSRHLAENHSSKRPFLLIGGVEPAEDEIIRQPVPASHVALENKTGVRIKRNGRAIAGDDLPWLLSQETDAIFEITLENGKESRAAPLLQSYKLKIEVPSKAALDDVDRAFRAYFSAGMPAMGDVATFLAETACQGVAHGYADALSGYVRAVLVKDQAPDTGVTLRPADANGMMMKALDYLRRFSRPVAQVICGYACFCQNDFSASAYPTGSARLDRVNACLAPLAGKTPMPISTDPAAGGAIVGICPIDQVSDRILDLAERLSRQTRWGKPLEEECRQAASAAALNADDAVKIRALWAATCLRLKQDEAAREPLSQLRNSYPFDAWAERECNRIEGETGV